MSAPQTYRSPMFLLTDDGYRATGAIVYERSDDRYFGHDTTGRKLFSRKTFTDAVRAGGAFGRVVTSAWYGVLPTADGLGNDNSPPAP